MNTMTDMATSTSSAMMSYSTPSYGSGMSNNGNSGYNNCVQQCVASYGALSPAATYTPSSTMGSSSGSSGSSGSGATHVVTVAPTQGVLRYVPFVLNASVGDTIQFMWGANNHTVTKSSELTPCNKTSDSPFTSGEQNKGFMFTQVVNDTNPTFFYCGTPTHCQKGMFGIINPPNALGSPMSVSGMMQSIAANNSDVAAYATYTDMQTSSNSGAAKWGGNIDLSTLPEWSHSLVAENVLYTRNFLAANPETLQSDGSVDLSAAGSTPLMIPQDLSAALAANSASTSAASTAATPSASTSSPAVSGAANAENAKSGAMSVSSPKVVVGLVAAFTTFLML
jgi:plastocyanin